MWVEFNKFCGSRSEYQNDIIEYIIEYHGIYHIKCMEDKHFCKWNYWDGTIFSSASIQICFIRKVYYFIGTTYEICFINTCIANGRGNDLENKELTNEARQCHHSGSELPPTTKLLSIEPLTLAQFS